MKVPARLKTVYSNHELGRVKTNASHHLNQSIATAVLHMQINHYDADYAEILDADTEKLYAHIVRHRFDDPDEGVKAGDIEILYKWNPRKTEKKFKLVKSKK